ncbi:MAG: glycine--tRNA ligase subunit beta [Piscinibacter sp.]|uniref:glycine--tRNA ligase subunit beta n=1 Tax=Piscinibacter sp. TaxID=1903157 RepID=UPI001B70810B|nr:glycine--tRNA ligase subunit beta [Piscinibacter sp.]MBP5991803.1 glycine--tRNA ligase subunit beta [Piscinibacter sp.]MBP6029168.1 glycine--tRNA ligase subunit beta [Piscinibacter sp.]
MTNTRNLLVELFVEELPPKSLKKLGEAFATELAKSLRAQGLAGEHSAITPFASPRRLAAHVSAVLARAPDRQVSIKLMPVAVGLAADGTPTPALLKKLAAVGADASVVPGLKRQLDGKAEALFLEGTAEGVTLADGLQKALVDALAALPIPKVMQYQLADGWSSVNFVRPAHGLVALHGADVVPVSVLGLAAGRQTRGHRFEAQMDPVVLLDADHYARQLEEQGGVIPGFAARHGELLRQLNLAAAKEGLAPIEDEALLDEVTALVERPNVLLCQFEPEFLAVPQECLILTMKANQKYFPLLDAAGKLTNKFLVVSNIRPADASRVIGGNERVVRPRLADAKFFFDQDRKKTLASRIDGLAKVVYHAKLGTMGERVERVRRIAAQIGQALGGAAIAQQAEQAAQLAKADLLTDMVGEFPELQGIMGGYYARHDGLAEDIAFAIEDHYKPRFAGDALPRNSTGLAVALADKLETLAGLFGIGQVPSGDKDPFALRRHALGLIRMLIERELPLELAHLVSIAFAAFPATHGQAQAELSYFLRERLVGYLREAGHAVQDVEAVIEARPPRWAEFPKRLAAVRAFKALPESQPLAAANKRVGNILKKSEEKVAPLTDAALFVEPAERALADALEAVAPRSEQAFAAGDYTGSLQALAALKTPVDAFFDAVMVNAEDAKLRANRLGLLAKLHEAMNRVADLSKLAAS